MEKQRPDINPMPHFELLPPRLHPLRIAVEAMHRHLFNLRSDSDGTSSSVDGMLLDDETQS